MAKDKAKAPAPGKQKGGKKSARRSAATIANKARRAEARVNRLLRAAERRASNTYVNPATGRAIRSTGTLRPILAKREKQAGKINKKREQRRLFFSLGKPEQRARRENGENQFGSKAPEYHQMRISPERWKALKKGEAHA